MIEFVQSITSLLAETIYMRNRNLREGEEREGGEAKIYYGSQFEKITSILAEQAWQQERVGHFSSE